MIEQTELQSKSKLLQAYFESADALFAAGCDMLHFGWHEGICEIDAFGRCLLHLEKTHQRQSALKEALEDYRNKANELEKSMNSGLKENANEGK